MKNLIFDYDGTLHNCIKIYAPSFRIAYERLVSESKAKEKDWSDTKISHWLGFNSQDMWNSFMPDLSKEDKEKCSNLIGSLMIKFIDEGKAELYPGALNVLNELKKSGYNLIFLSNCKQVYMESHINNFHLDQYFNKFYCAEEYDFKPKHEIFKVISSEFSGDFVIIGDRYQDIEVAMKHGLKSIGCNYGYGNAAELSNSTITINQTEDILSVISSII